MILNLRLSDFLSREIKKSSLAEQIPSGAHIFHGTHKDTDLTQANLNLATNILLGMTLGFVEKAPLMMVFVSKSDQEILIDLSNEAQKRKAGTLIQTFREQTQQEMSTKINELVAL